MSSINATSLVLQEKGELLIKGKTSGILCLGDSCQQNQTESYW